MKGKHSERKKNKFIWYAILIILIGILIYSAYQIVFWIKSNNELKQLEDTVFAKVVKEESIEVINDNNEEETKKETKRVIDFEELKKINTDVIGWITIDNTNINYPITQAEDNDYYLKRDINKNLSSCGNIFLDCDNKNDFTDANSVIYGHNLRSGGMFGDLKDINEGKLGDEVYVKIYTPENEYTYQVIAAYVAEPKKQIIKKEFIENEKQEYINRGIRNSSIKFKNSATSNKNMITLISCYGDNRTVVNALRID